MHRLRLVRMVRGELLRLSYIGTLDSIPTGWSIQCRRVA